MIRLIRLICINLCILSFAAYAGVSIYDRSNVDTTAPEIIMTDKEVTISVQDDEDQILAGITAEDDRDGDVTSYLTLENLSNFISPGTRTAAIAVFDEAGNVSRESRTVHYSDYTPPRVILTAPLSAPLSDVTSLLDHIQVVDCLDGDITENLQIVPAKSISLTSPGTYEMQLQVSNLAGDTLDLPVTVDFYNASDRKTQVIELTDYLVYVKKGESVDPLSYLKSLKLYTDTYIWDEENRKFTVEQVSEQDSDDEESNWDYDYETPSIGLDEIDIYDPVDTSVPGTYEIQYRFENYDNVTDTSVRLIVVVEEE